MQISEIRERRKGLAAVIADGKEFLLDSDTVAAAGIKKGDCLTEEELSSLGRQSDCARARSRALWYLSRGDQSRRTLYDKLRRAFPADAAESAVARMEELGLVDDRRYAENIAAALSAANVSNREIERKLFVKGVPSDIAKAAVEGLCADPVAQIHSVIEKKYAKNLSTEDGVRKTYAALLRKGFSFSDVKTALKAYSENLDNCEEF